jgi:hypothetical protein
MATTLAVVIKPGGGWRADPLLSSVADGVQSEKGSPGGCWSGFGGGGNEQRPASAAPSDGERSRRCCGFGGERFPHRSSGFQARHPCMPLDRRRGSRRSCGHYDIRIRNPALPNIIHCSTTHHSPSNPGKSSNPLCACWQLCLGAGGFDRGELLVGRGRAELAEG